MRGQQETTGKDWHKIVFTITTNINHGSFQQPYERQSRSQSVSKPWDKTARLECRTGRPHTNPRALVEFSWARGKLALSVGTSLHWIHGCGSYRKRPRHLGVHSVIMNETAVKNFFNSRTCFTVRNPFGRHRTCSSSTSQFVISLWCQKRRFSFTIHSSGVSRWALWDAKFMEFSERWVILALMGVNFNNQKNFIKLIAKWNRCGTYKCE